MIGEAVLDFLHDGGCAVDGVKDGQMAETALMTGPFDLMLLDLGLPRKDGLEVLRGLRQRHDRMPVLIATARTQRKQRSTYRAQHATSQTGCNHPHQDGRGEDLKKGAWLVQKAEISPRNNPSLFQESVLRY